MAKTDAQRAAQEPAPIPDEVRTAVDAALGRQSSRVTLMDLPKGIDMCLVNGGIDFEEDRCCHWQDFHED